MKSTKKCAECAGTDSYGTWHVKWSPEVGDLLSWCHRCWRGDFVPGDAESFTKEGRRALHWNDIRTRIRTHEGELLSGRKGELYQQKYSQQYLGRDISKSQKIDRHYVSHYQQSQGK